MSQGQTILVVEDNVGIREALQLFFEMHDYPVVTASNGLEALALLPELENLGIIFLDFNMPVMGGKEFLEEKIKASLCTDVPVVMLGADLYHQDVDGIVEWIRKPCDLDVLYQAVQKYCH